MKENQVSKRVYVKPEIEVVIVRTDCHLLDASVSGGHHSADDDETLNAKETDFFDEEDFSTISENAW